MELSDVYGCFSEVGAGVKNLQGEIKVFFGEKEKLVRQMERNTTFYLVLTLNARTKLLTFIEKKEIPFWECLEKTAKPYGKLLIKSDLKKIAPESYDQAISIAGQIENIKGIAYQMQYNLKEQYDALVKIKREDYVQPLKIFSQKYNEQKHLYNELILERDRIVFQLSALCPRVAKEAKVIRDKSDNWRNFGDGVGAAASAVLFVASLASLGYSWDSTIWQRMNFEWNTLMAMIGGGSGAAIVVALSGGIIKKNAQGISLFMRDVRSLL